MKVNRLASMAAALRKTRQKPAWCWALYAIYLAVTMHLKSADAWNIAGIRIQILALFRGKKMAIETERLILRNYTMDDFDALFEIMSDAETMKHYPAPFDEERTRGWIQWNLENYEKYGWGLWAVVLKETGEFIGDCGITLQNIDGEQLPEIGYHIHKKYWRRGFAKEAARAVRDWVFQNTKYDAIYSYMKYTNVASYSTAIANGMKKVKEYPDPKNEISYAYAITRREWQAYVLSQGKN